jgi:nitrous oxidase accessory protein
MKRWFLSFDINLKSFSEDVIFSADAMKTANIRVCVFSFVLSTCFLLVFSVQPFGIGIEASVAGTGAESWTVDANGSGDFRSIVDAVAAASPGDTIIVNPGTYSENVVVDKGVTIKSQMGAENTIVCTPDPFSGQPVIDVMAGEVTVSGFTVTGTYGYGGGGIYLNSVQYCTISDNVCYNNSAGIMVYNSDNNEIINNDASNNQDGIYLHHSNDNKIIGNIASKSTYGRGIMLVFSSYNQILNNIVNSNRDEGIILMESGTSNNLIANNTVIFNSNYGIHFFAADNNQILNNTLMKNGVGVWLRGASKTNEIANNAFLENSYGIYLGDPSNHLGDCSNNVIYHNNFVDNLHTVFIYESISAWDDGYPSGGNYWNGYNGSDADGDGIGDTPYTINLENKDNYPLMAPFVSPSVSPSLSFENQYVFDVVSNSTISDLSFSSAEMEIHFTATGPADTSGCTLIILAKSLIPYPADVVIFLDGEAVEYTTTEMENVWILTVNYSHSTHDIVVDLPEESVPELPSTVLIASLMLMVLSAVIVLKKFQKSPSKTSEPEFTRI